MEIVQVHVKAKPNGAVSEEKLRIQGPMREIEWQENSGIKGLRHDHQARSVNNRWIPDFGAGMSRDIWGLLIARGTGSFNMRNARLDIGLVSEPVENAFRRFGYFEQYYWKDDVYPIFAGAKSGKSY